MLLAKIFNHPEANYISLKPITTKLMATLLDKKLSTVFGVLLISLFHFAAFASSSSTSFVAATAAARDEVGKEWKETEALLKWKASLDNQSQSQLSSWGGGGNPCKWVGIVCDESGSLTGLHLSSFGLIGTLSNLSFSSFPNLLTINLSKNSLYGTIPDLIGNLSKLTYLELANNALSGTVTSSVCNLCRLSYLDFSGNQLFGRIPLEIGLLTSLQVFALNGNDLNGSIPTSIGNLGNLSRLYLYNNSFSGFLPHEIGKLHNLVHLYLRDNALSGSIP